MMTGSPGKTAESAINGGLAMQKRTYYCAFCNRPSDRGFIQRCSRCVGLQTKPVNRRLETALKIAEAEKARKSA